MELILCVRSRRAALRHLKNIIVEKYRRNASLLVKFPREIDYKFDTVVDGRNHTVMTENALTY